jgi:hypothetical protein
VDIAEQLETHISSPKQTLLLGAGISYISDQLGVSRRTVYHYFSRDGAAG